jgi:CheY-like chemotaxis protein
VRWTTARSPCSWSTTTASCARGPPRCCARTSGSRSPAWPRDGREALALAERRAPDVVLLDLDMPELPGLETCAALRERHPDMPPNELVQAVLEAGRGEPRIAPRLARRMLAELGSESAQAADPLAVLSAREREILGRRPHARAGASPRTAARARGGQHRVADQVAPRGAARRGAQDGGRHLLGDLAIAARGQRGAPDAMEVGSWHDATLRAATRAVIDRKAEPGSGVGAAPGDREGDRLVAQRRPLGLELEPSVVDHALAHLHERPPRRQPGADVV